LHSDMYHRSRQWSVHGVLTHRRRNHKLVFNDSRRTYRTRETVAKKIAIDTKHKAIYHIDMKIPENDKIVTIKMSTGEEVVAKIKDQDELTLTLDRPVVIMISQQGLAFGAFIPTMESVNGVAINKSAIVAIGPCLDKVSTEYSNAVSPIKTVTKSSLIV
jgi:hypothetical protein